MTDDDITNDQGKSRNGTRYRDQVGGATECTKALREWISGKRTSEELEQMANDARERLQRCSAREAQSTDDERRFLSELRETYAWVSMIAVVNAIEHQHGRMTQGQRHDAVRQTARQFQQTPVIGAILQIAPDTIATRSINQSTSDKYRLASTDLDTAFEEWASGEKSEAYLCFRLDEIVSQFLERPLGRSPAQIAESVSEYAMLRQKAVLCDAAVQFALDYNVHPARRRELRKSLSESVVRDCGRVDR